MGTINIRECKEQAGNQPLCSQLMSPVLMQTLSHMTKAIHHLVMVFNWSKVVYPIVADIRSVLEEHLCFDL